MKNIFLDTFDYVIFGAKYQNKSYDFCVLRTKFKITTKILRHKIALLSKKENVCQILCSSCWVEELMIDTQVGIKINHGG